MGEPKKGRQIFKVEWFIRDQRTGPWSRGVWWTFSIQAAKRSYSERVTKHQTTVMSSDMTTDKRRSMDPNTRNMHWGRLGHVSLTQGWVEDLKKEDLILNLLHGFGVIDGERLFHYSGMEDPQFKESPS